MHAQAGNTHPKYSTALSQVITSDKKGCANFSLNIFFWVDAE
jgi:hypothetical protein